MCLMILRHKKGLGVDIRGRSRTVRVNYRTSHQIRRQADRLLGPVVVDVDGNNEDRSDTVSVVNGPAPVVLTLKDEHVESVSGQVSISTMHLAKGLEFRAVVVMACDDEIIPLHERIESVGDDADLQAVYDTP